MITYKCKCKNYDKNKIIFMFQDLDTSYIIIDNLKYLNIEYPYFFSTSVNDIQSKYNEGYRIFISVSTSSVLKTFLDWFVEHPDAYMISCISISADPIFTQRQMKNIYRIANNATNYTKIEANVIKSKLSDPNNATIYLVYERDDNASINEKNLLKQNLNGYIVYEREIYDEQSIDNILDEITANNNIFSALSASNTNIIDLFHIKVATKQFGYFIEYYASLPSLESSLIDRYYFVLYECPHERNVEKLINDLGIENVFLSIYDSINMAKSLEKNRSINSKEIKNDLVGTNGYLYFDNVLDRNFPFYITYELSNNSIWNPINVDTTYDMTAYTLSLYNLDFIQRESLLTPYSYNSTICGKICFFLQDIIVDNDIILNAKLLNIKYKIFRSTYDNGNFKPISYLESLYKRGYRIFIGFNNTSTLLYFKPFFDKYKDCICISLYSTGEILDLRSNINIYRMLPSDRRSYSFYNDFMNTVNNTPFTYAYYIVQTDDPFSEQLFSGISSISSIPFTRFDVNISTTASEYDNIYNQINTNQNNIGIICVVDDMIVRNIYLRCNNNICTFLNGGSTTPPISGVQIPTTAKNCYFLMFNPPYERNIQKLYDTLGPVTAYPLIDVSNMANSISKYGTFNNVIGSYGYTYFTQNGDRNFLYYVIRLYDGNIWNINMIYNIVNNKCYKYK